MLWMVIACTGTTDPGFKGGATPDTGEWVDTGEPFDPLDPDNWDGPYSELCQHDLPSEIFDASGTLEFTGLPSAPVRMPAGASVDGTGGLTIVACVPNLQDETPILDAVVFDMTLSLFSHDDAPIEMGVAGDATSVHGLSGNFTDWKDVVPWDEDETFFYMDGGSASFSQVDKDGGRLVGEVDVTATDPVGYPFQITVDLSW